MIEKEAPGRFEALLVEVAAAATEAEVSDSGGGKERELRWGEIEAVWLVLGARGDVSRRVITCIGWDGFVEDVLLVCGGPSH
ncbi:hypothetical protein D5086_006108 [Populus alba]|uniref:Uncharacterized protein n=2 Tax=Populus alba TaxID=43335 RepID=A0ACC4AJT4_POPAL